MSLENVIPHAFDQDIGLLFHWITFIRNEFSLIRDCNSEAFFKFLDVLSRVANDFLEVNRWDLYVSFYHSKIKLNLFDDLVHDFDNSAEFLQLFFRSRGRKFKMLLKVIIRASAAVIPEESRSYLFKKYEIFAEDLHFYLVEIELSFPLVQMLIFVLVFVFRDDLQQILVFVQVFVKFRLSKFQNL